jgi:hypothetical protein
MVDRAPTGDAVVLESGPVVVDALLLAVGPDTDLPDLGLLVAAKDRKVNVERVASRDVRFEHGPPSLSLLHPAGGMVGGVVWESVAAPPRFVDRRAALFGRKFDPVAVALVAGLVSARDLEGHPAVALQVQVDPRIGRHDAAEEKRQGEHDERRGSPLRVSALV